MNYFENCEIICLPFLIRFDTNTFDPLSIQNLKKTINMFSGGELKTLLEKYCKQLGLMVDTLRQGLSPRAR